MDENRQKLSASKVDTKEFELPETLYVRDIENRVFQGIVLQSLAQIEGITLVEGNLIDSLLGRSTGEAHVKGISAEQDSKSQSVAIKVEVNICYGYSIPEKADEIQTQIAGDITRLTGLHVSCVHVVFKNVLSREQAEQLNQSFKSRLAEKEQGQPSIEEEYSDEF